MSARDRLVELVLKNEPDHGNAMFVDLLGCAMTAEEMKGSVMLWLDAYRAEVLTEAAEKIRRWADAAEGHLFDEERCGALGAADHIDPDAP